MFPSLNFIDIPFFALTIISAVAYVILLSKIMDGWDDTDEHEIPDNYIPTTKISVIIAARNEENFVLQCIQSILNCNYPKDLFEIVVVNDHSEDKTEKILEKIKEPNVRIINMKEAFGKKKALEAGIAIANGELIACTDADCLVPEDWLKSFESLYNKTKAKCIAGPITYLHDKSLLQRFQFLEALNNMCVTANGIIRKSYFMANGANLWFTRDVFNEVGGYGNHLEFASGDDMFLIQQVAERYPSKVLFLKSQNAIVQTQPETTLSGFVQQRKRWATKSKAYSNKNIFRIQGFVFYFVILLVLNLLFMPLGSGLSLMGFIFALFIKWTIDFLYLSKLATYFNDRKPLKSFFGASIGFLIYILFAGWHALSPTPHKWKGRENQ